MSRLCPYDSLYWFIFVCLMLFYWDGLWILRTACQSLFCPEAVASSFLVHCLAFSCQGGRVVCLLMFVVSYSFSIFSFLKSLQIDNVICGKTCRPECWVNFLCGYWIKVYKCRYRVTVPRENTLLKIACFCVWLEKPHREWTVYGILLTENGFCNHLYTFHKLEEYIRPDSFISYESDYMMFSCSTYLKCLLYGYKRWGISLLKQK